MRAVPNASLFIKRTSKFVLFMFVYVDNILITGLNSTALHAFIGDLIKILP